MGAGRGGGLWCGGERGPSNAVRRHPHLVTRNSQCKYEAGEEKTIFTHRIWVKYRMFPRVIDMKVNATDSSDRPPTEEEPPALNIFAVVHTISLGQGDYCICVSSTLSSFYQ